MTINKIAYVQVESLKKLQKFIDTIEISSSNHIDGCEEEEIWIKIEENTLDKIDKIYLNEQEYNECKKENVEYIIFYE